MTVFAEKHYPEIMRPEELDAYLSHGWYRMGQTIFTTHFLCFDERFYSAVWIRLSLSDYTFRKSLRKLLRRNDKIFQTFFRKAFIDQEKEQLYQKYKASFPGLLAPSLRDSLLDGEDFNIYDTYEVAVYHDDRLIGVSFFDLGREAVASIMGMYDPDFARYSLGFFTMLKEIEYAREQGFEYYYPGYVVPGYARFDYKLRIGPVDYFDLTTGSWLPYDQLPAEEIPLVKMENHLQQLHDLAAAKDLSTRLLYYPLFEVNLFGFWRTNFFDHPVFLLCLPEVTQDFYLMTVFDVREEKYVLYRCSPFDDIQFYFNEGYTKSFNKDFFFMELVTIDRILEKTASAEQIVRALTSISKRPSSSAG